MTTFSPLLASGQSTSGHRPDEMTMVTPLQNESTSDLGYDKTEMFIPWNNPDNIISFETFVSFETVMTCGVSLILVTVGVPTNLLNCLVFYRQGLRDRMNLCLFSLALVDMLFVTFFYVVCSHCLVGHLFPDVSEWWRFFARKYFTGIYRGFLYSSGLLTLVIAVERCVCVTQPLKAATLVKTRTIALIIVSIVLSLQVVCLLYPLELSIGTMEDPDTGKITLFLTTTEFRSRYILLYNIVENTLIMIVIPFFTFTVVTIATAITVVQLKRAIAWRHGSSSSSSSDVREVALVKMLVVVSLIYIITAAPNVVLGLTRLLVPNFLPSRKYANIFLASHLMYLVLTQVNSSVNFFVYLARSSRFRQELRHLLRRVGIRVKTESSGRLSDTAVTTAKERSISELSPGA